jgi:hypothetical protein
MIFYTWMFAILQSFLCLPALLTVIPFFEDSTNALARNATIVDSLHANGTAVEIAPDAHACAGLNLGLLSKIENGTSDENLAFFGCIGLMLTTFMAEMWLSRTHFIQYWKYQGIVIFVPDDDDEEDDDGKDGGKRMQLKQQRMLLTRSSRLRGNLEGDTQVIKSLVDRFGIVASTSEDYVGLTDLDVRTALTQQMESNYREWKKLDEMDGAAAAMETLKMQRSIDSSGV